MVFIRRELPRTYNAGQDSCLPQADLEGSPFRVPLDRHLLDCTDALFTP